MTDANYVLGVGGSTPTLNANTSYTALGNVSLSNTIDSTESHAQVPWYAAGTFSKLRCRISSNAANATSTLTFRKGGVSGNQSVSIGATLTGEFSDLSNTDTIVSGDLVCAQIVAGGAGALTMTAIGGNFNANTGVYMRYGYCMGASTTTASTTWYMGLTGIGGTLVTTETNQQATMRGNGTFGNGYAIVTTNARSTATTIKFRKNGADGNISVSCTASTTGLFEDVSHTDTVVNGDNVNYSVTTSTGTGAFQALQFGVDFKPSGNVYPLIGGSANGSALATGTSVFTPVSGGQRSSASAEAGLTISAQTAFTASNLFCQVKANAATTATTVTVRKNSANGNGTISIGAGLTGYFEDTSNTDSFSATDTMSYDQVIGATSTTTICYVGMFAKLPATYLPNFNKPILQAVNRASTY